MTGKTAIIIGNGKLESAFSGVVDDAQFVVRFNKPNLADDMSGSRKDMLMLAASGKVLHRRMIDPDFLENAALKSAQVPMLAYHPEVIRKYHPRPNIFQRLGGRRADWTMQTIDLIGHAGKEISIMPPQFLRTAVRRSVLWGLGCGRCSPAPASSASVMFWQTSLPPSGISSSAASAGRDGSGMIGKMSAHGGEETIARCHIALVA